MSRADVSEKDLKKLPNFYLYVDEFQSFANESFADILSEARKYKLNLTIAHQYIEQMSEEVRAAVFGNVGTMITFRVGAYDADVLEKEFAPQFTAEDLVNLGMFQMYLKLMIDSVTSQPFSASSLPPFPEPVISYKSEIIASSRRQFAQPKMMVEEAIQRWHDDGKQKDMSKKDSNSSDRNGGQTKLFNGNGVRKDFGIHSGQQTLCDTNKKVEPPKENKKVQELPPLESETDDGFLPLKEMVKKVVVEEKKEVVIEDKDKKKTQNNNKTPNKQNLSDLKSALQAVLKDNVVKKVENSVEKESIVVEKKQPVEQVKEENKEKYQQKEIPESELKKILGIE